MLKTINGVRVKVGSDVVFLSYENYRYMCKKPSGFEARIEELEKRPTDQWGSTYDIFFELFHGPKAQKMVLDTTIYDG